jgi:hypothetical protein
VAAPPAVIVTVFVAQTDGLVTVIVGLGLTVTVPVAVAVQPAALVPVTVYVVVPPAVKVGLAPVDALKLVAGFHE